MSEQSGGPGWWQASDGKWYPPEPVTTQLPTAPPPGPPPGPPTGPPTGQIPPPPPYVAPAAAAGAGGGAGKVVAIVVVLALLAGGGAFLLTRDSGGGGGNVADFCKKADVIQNLDDIADPDRADAVVAAFDAAAKVAPTEIKSDANTLNDAAKRSRDNVKAGRSADAGFSASDTAKITAAAANVERFAEEKCGIVSAGGSSDDFSSFTFDSDFDSDFSDAFSDFSDFSDPFSDFSDFSDFSFDTDSFSSEFDSLCSQFGSDFCS